MLSSEITDAFAAQVFAELEQALNRPAFQAGFNQLKAGSVADLNHKITGLLSSTAAHPLSAPAVATARAQFAASYPSLGAFMAAHGVREGRVQLAEVRTALSLGAALRQGPEAALARSKSSTVEASRLVYVAALLAVMDLQRASARPSLALVGDSIWTSNGGGWAYEGAQFIWNNDGKNMTVSCVHGFDRQTNANSIATSRPGQTVRVVCNTGTYVEATSPSGQTGGYGTFIKNDGTVVRFGPGSFPPRGQSSPGSGGPRTPNGNGVPLPP